MSVRELLADLGARGIHLRVEDGELVCSAPEGALTDEVREQLVTHRVALVRFLEQGQGKLGGARITPRDPRARLPLSVGQESLWISLEGGMAPAAFNLPAAWWLNGPVRPEALEACIRDIVQRHEILRTSIQLVDGVPEQIVHEQVDLPIERMDLRRLPRSQRREDAQRWMAEDAMRPFELASAPLIRFAIFRLDEEEFALYLLASHLIWDGWSFDVFLEELAVGYEALVAGRASPAPPLAIQYGDYTVWQRGWIGGEEYREQLDYWKGRLSGSLPVMEMPTDRARPPRQSFRGAIRESHLPPSISQAVAGLARRHGCTPFMVLATAFNVLLHRWSGQEELLIGYPQAGVDSSEQERMIGFFVNTLVMRTQLGDDPTFLDLLRRVRADLLESAARKDVPFEHVVAAVAPPRDPSRTPLCQALLTYQDARRRRLAMGQVQIDQFHVQMGFAQADFMFWMKEHEGGIQYGMIYATDLFDAETVDRMLESFRHVLGGVVTDPERRVSDLPVQSDAEARRQFLAGQGEEMLQHRGLCLHQLFERTARAAPDQPALRCGEAAWTYAELDARANRIARRLRRIGVGPGILVAVALDRSLELVAGLLGVLKAGGAYLPLDPAFPPARLTLLLEDSRARILVGSAATLGAFSLSGLEVLDLDREAAELSRLPPDPIEDLSDPSDLAYVMYTSGSTGLPKGAMVEHRNVVNLLEGAADRFRARRRGVCLAGSSISFDFSVYEIFGSLAHGFELVLAADPRSAKRLEDLADVPALIRRHGVTHYHCTPSQATLLLSESSGREALARLEQWMLGGEAFSAELASELRSVVHGRIFNAYGPTEAAVMATVEEVEEARGAVPLGRPLPNVSVYVLDERLRPVPQGVPGELVIGGEGVGRGYLGQPELTARLFLPDPYRAGADARMYRTGDRVRRRNDGKLEFLGRSDHQVKIRGVRIELGEIENALEGHPAVREAVATVHRLGPNDLRLVAYVRADGDADPYALRAFLAERLPEAMVPAAVVLLERFPLTPSNKVDRAALPLPEGLARRGAAGEAASDQPDGDGEYRMLALWEEVLGVSGLGVNDDFFALGGHSLLALELVQKFRRVFARELPLALVFAKPTVRELVRAMDLQAGEERTPVITLRRGDADRNLFCICGVQLYHDLAAAMPDGHSVHGIFIPSEEVVPDVVDLASKYLAAIREVQPRGPYHLAGFCFGGLLAYEIAVRLREQGEEVGSLTLIESYLYRGWSVRPWAVVRQGLRSLFRRGSGSFLKRAWKKMLRITGLVPESVAGQAEPFRGQRGGVMTEAEEAAFGRASRRYERRLQPFDGRIVHVRAGDEPDAGLYRIQAGGGFAEVATGGIDIHAAPGTHQSLLKRGPVTYIARIIARAMRAARSKRAH